jgi:hypothetical protein
MLTKSRYVKSVALISLISLFLLILIHSCRPESNAPAVAVFDGANASGCNAWLIGELELEDCQIKLTQPAATLWLPCGQNGYAQVYFNSETDYLEFESPQFQFCESGTKIVSGTCSAFGVESVETGDGIIKIWMEEGFFQCAWEGTESVTFKLPISL